MKKILLTLTMLLTAVSVMAADVEVTGKKLNMRIMPDVNSEAIRTFKTGYKLKTIDETETVINGERWIKAYDSDGATGYVRMDYIKKISTSEQFKRDVQNISNRLFKTKAVSQDKILSNKNNIESNIVMISGEGLHRVEISLKDLNRITCNGNISDPIYSRDKEIEISRGGKKDLFVKISPVKITTGGTTEVRYNDFPRELYVECNGMVYNLSLLPKEDKPSQTIVFKSPLADTKKAMNYEKSTAYETMISDLFKVVYMEQIPEGYSVKKGSLKYEFSEMDMRLRYVYTGHNFIVEDWEIKSKMAETIELEENLFVPVLKNPRAISLTVPRLAKNETGRLLVIRASSLARE